MTVDDRGGVVVAVRNLPRDGPFRDAHGDGYYAVANETDATFNYYSEEDDVLKYAYNSFEWDQALGETGIESGNTAPSNHTDRNVTSQVGGDHSSYLANCSDDIVADM